MNKILTLIISFITFSCSFKDYETQNQPFPKTDSTFYDNGNIKGIYTQVDSFTVFELKKFYANGKIKNDYKWISFSKPSNGIISHFDTNGVLVEKQTIFFGKLYQTIEFDSNSFIRDISYYKDGEISRFEAYNSSGHRDSFRYSVIHTPSKNFNYNADTIIVDKNTKCVLKKGNQLNDSVNISVITPHKSAYSLESIDEEKTSIHFKEKGVYNIKYRLNDIKLLDSGEIKSIGIIIDTKPYLYKVK